MATQEAIKIPVPTGGAEKKKAGDEKKKKKEDDANELPEEDRKIKEEVELCVARIMDTDATVVEAALGQLSRLLREATGSMTSVPKPLKYVRGSYAELCERFKECDAPVGVKMQFSDVLSVVATATAVGRQRRHALRWRLNGTRENWTSWGHEYVRNICTEIIAERASLEDPSRADELLGVVEEEPEDEKEIEEKEKNLDDKEKETAIKRRLAMKAAKEAKTAELKALRDRLAWIERSPVSEADISTLVHQAAPYLTQHHAESEAVDLLCEINAAHEMVGLVTEPSTARRVCQYLRGLAKYAGSEPEAVSLLTTAYKVYVNVGELCDALTVALRMQDSALVKQCFTKAAGDTDLQLQLAFILARARWLPDDWENYDLDESVLCAARNEKLASYFKHLATDLDVLEPKLPEDVFKSHLEESRGRPTAGALDSAKQNLAATFANAFVNCGYASDKLIVGVENGAWLFKNKEHGMMSATASVGLLTLWSIDEGLGEVDKFQWSQEKYIKAGAYMAFGLVCSGVRDENDPAWALLQESIDSEEDLLKMAAVVGLGHAYAGRNREEIVERLTPLVVDSDVSLTCSTMAALTTSLIYAGKGDEDLAQVIHATLQERAADSSSALDGAMGGLTALSLGILFMGPGHKGAKLDEILEGLSDIQHPVGQLAKILVRGCSAAATGDTLIVQKMFHDAADEAIEGREESTEKEKEKELTPMEAAVKGMPVLMAALVAMGEETGSEMIVRMMDRVLQYGSTPQRRAVPLALALTHLSNPKVTIADTLGKLSHDTDFDVACNAIFALGLVGAGTNNARLAGQLRQLASYYKQDANALFMVRISQGLLYLGKGLMTLSPFYADKQCVDYVALSGVLVTLTAAMFSKETFFGKEHWLLYHLTAAIRPRMVVAVTNDMEPVKVPVRVGQAVDTTGAPGRPKTITGFQTLNTPVLVASAERAEIANDEWEALTRVLEGVVVVRKKAADEGME